MTAGNNIQFRRTPEIETALSGLQTKTGLNQAAVIRLAIMEMAERRGVSAEVGTAEGRKTTTVKKRRRKA